MTAWIKQNLMTIATYIITYLAGVGAGAAIMDMIWRGNDDKNTLHKIEDGNKHREKN